MNAVNEEADRWKNSLIGNFLGRRPNYAYVKEITSRIWKLKGGMDVSLLDNGVFVFRFTCEEDKVCVLEGGPWMIAKRPLILCALSKKVAIERMDLQKIPLWVSLPGLPLQYWAP